MALFFLHFLILLFSSDVSSLLSCFTDHCPGDNTSLCLTICPRTYQACFRNTTFPPSLHFERLPRLGCSRLDCRISCDYEEYDSDEGGEYCCCTSNYCNEETALAHLIKPKFNYHLPPLDRASVPKSDKLMCEFYDCTTEKDGNCIHQYKTCLDCPIGYTCTCQTVYKANRTANKLYLYSKGCAVIATANKNDFRISPECFINVSYAGPLFDEYVCYCDRTMCNVNETVLHPTRLMSYGVRECIERGCEYSCQVIKNRLWCLCPPGLRTTFGLYCYDVNECIVANGGCDHLCINTRGSYHCECYNGYILDTASRKCIRTSSAFYCSSYYSIDIPIKNITKSDIGREPCVTGSCYAQYRYDDEEKNWYLSALTCGRFPTSSTDTLPSCSNPQCELKELEQIPNMYHCCCSSLNCNNISLIHFMTSSTSTSTTATVPTLTITGTSDAIGIIGFWTVIVVFVLLLIVCSLFLVMTTALIIKWKRNMRTQPPTNNLQMSTLPDRNNKLD
ncbi:PREDICTED: signal peptide, CUB and EGF-like domain-containing protein 1 [Amphimedon queenslandica]|uniref:EGF-like domain-containing protein n=2 Tax=Amphimedon queenslandica TaxID=400682 RepID=A0AAN0IWM6_AMPQE|nr:PREDICTED: signal peptide, CUB and EGF-like domain-containing protein 1 [Amphimedon queenslandica]|eukprot:XP_019849179.1 PREDICTED: signal peptide, CUB and EGF-like domain-containing protein 1 [Amphimedon queenslandica]